MHFLFSSMNQHIFIISYLSMLYQGNKLWNFSFHPIKTIEVLKVHSVLYRVLLTAPETSHNRHPAPEESTTPAASTCRVAKCRKIETPVIRATQKVTKLMENKHACLGIPCVASLEEEGMVSVTEVRQNPCCERELVKYTELQQIQNTCRKRLQAETIASNAKT